MKKPKHTFLPWRSYPEDAIQINGLLRASLMPGDSFTQCQRCGVHVKVAGHQSTPKFFVAGTWCIQRPPCTAPAT